MRTALVQLGSNLPPAEVQVTRLQSLRPDQYHIEESPTLQAAQRVIEHLEQLAKGDELCLFSLAALRLEPGETAHLLAVLVKRGVRCLTFDEAGTPFDLGPSAPAGDVLHLLSEAYEASRRGDLATSVPRPENASQLLGDDQIEDIRRLARAGLTPRRIGLIYRRTPDCIRALLRRDNVSAAPVAATPQRHFRLHKRADR